MTTDTSEKGLERLICTALTGADCDPPQGGMVRERPSTYGAGWICGDPQDYDREYCVDLPSFRPFSMQPNPTPQNRWTSARTVRRGAGSWPAYRGKSPGEGPSTCSARASSTARTRST